MFQKVLSEIEKVFVWLLGRDGDFGKIFLFLALNRAERLGRTEQRNLDSNPRPRELMFFVSFLALLSNHKKCSFYKNSKITSVHKKKKKRGGGFVKYGAEKYSLE